MVISIKLDLNVLRIKKNDFSWPQISCPKCGLKMWRHGLVNRYFEGFKDTFFIQRYRCRFCRIVAVLRPESHWRRYQSSIRNIFESLTYRVRHFKWPPGVRRQRAGHWIKSFLLKVKSDLLMKNSLYETIIFFQQKNLSIF